MQSKLYVCSQNYAEEAKVFLAFRNKLLLKKIVSLTLLDLLIREEIQIE